MTLSATEATSVARAALERLNQGLAARDPELAESFAETALLLGSERTEICRGRAAIRDQLANIYAGASRIAFHWRDVVGEGIGSGLWLFAEGEVVMLDEPEHAPLPYRLTAILEPFGETWLWRLFHGVEPVER